MINNYYPCIVGLPSTNMHNRGRRPNVVLQETCTHNLLGSSSEIPSNGDMTDNTTPLSQRQGWNGKRMINHTAAATHHIVGTGARGSAEIKRETVVHSPGPEIPNITLLPTSVPREHHQDPPDNPSNVGDTHCCLRRANNPLAWSLIPGYPTGSKSCPVSLDGCWLLFFLLYCL